MAIVCQSDTAHHYTDTCEAMQESVESCVIHSIGLSNVNKTQTEEVLAINSKHYLQQKDYRFLYWNGIVFQAFSSLVIGDTNFGVRQSLTGG